MRYITGEDLLLDSYEVFIKESTSDALNILEDTEKRAIALVKTYLTRYDVETIFGIPIIPEEGSEGEEESEEEYTPPIRHELLAEIISKITLFKVFRRNAARKIPQDIKEDYEWAIKELEKIRNGSVVLKGLPPALDESGKIKSQSFWGNNSNPDFYI